MLNLNQYFRDGFSQDDDIIHVVVIPVLSRCIHNEPFSLSFFRTSPLNQTLHRRSPDRRSPAYSELVGEEGRLSYHTFWSGYKEVELFV